MGDGERHQYPAADTYLPALLVRAEQSILDLYQGEKLAFEIERTRSRLLEMQSEDYLAEEHRVEG